MEFTFVAVVFSAGFLLGSYFFYIQFDSSISDKCDAMMHHVEELFDEWRMVLVEDRDLIKSSLEKYKIEISKIKDEIDILKEQKKEAIKPLRKLPLKNNDKSSEDNKN